MKTRIWRAVPTPRANVETTDPCDFHPRVSFGRTTADLQPACPDPDEHETFGCRPGFSWRREISGIHDVRRPRSHRHLHLHSGPSRLPAHGSGLLHDHPVADEGRACQIRDRGSAVRHGCRRSGGSVRRRTCVALCCALHQRIRAAERARSDSDPTAAHLRDRSHGGRTQHHLRVVGTSRSPAVHRTDRRMALGPHELSSPSSGSAPAQSCSPVPT